MSYKADLLSKLDSVVEEAEQEIKNKHSFYSPQLDKDGIVKSINIDRVKLLAMLMENGFYRYDMSVDSFCFVQILDKKVKQVSPTYIMDWWFAYLKELPDYTWITSKRDSEGDYIEVTIKKDYIQNKFLMAIGSYFSDSILSRLTPEEKILFNEDTKSEKYVYYKNGFVTITKHGYSFSSDYSLLKHHVWENQILSRNYNQDKKDRYSESEFYTFCYNVANKNTNRLVSLQTIIGYTLHSFNKYKMKATILTDAQIGLEGEANGRTGKGIFANGLAAMLNNQDNQHSKVYCQINGKGFDFNDKHRYAKADINTKLIHLEDVKAYFLFDNLFNDITENITVDIKNEKPFNIYTKILISTNKTIKIKGDSAKDRAIQFEFSEHYSQSYSPEDEFGHWLFTDWSNEEWELFDSYMIYSIYQFFKNDSQVIEPEAINLNRRALIEHTSQEFINYMDYYGFTDEDHSKGTPIAFYLIPEKDSKMEYLKKELYNDFIENYPDMLKQKRFSQAKFTSWLRAYADASDFLQPINPDKDERRSSNKDYITLNRRE